MAFVVDKAGKVVLTRRSKKKSLWGGFWDASVVSHILLGETPIYAANRRGKEELGVDVQFELLGGFYYFAAQNNMAENEYCYVLWGTTRQNISPNPLEIDKIRHTTFAKLKSDATRQPDTMTPWLLLALAKISKLHGNLSMTSDRCTQ